MHALARKLLPVQPMQEGSATASNEHRQDFPTNAVLAVTVDPQTREPLVELYTKFLLTQEQVAIESEDFSALSQVQRTTRVLALAEDLMIFLGWLSGLPTGLDTAQQAAITT